MAWKWNGLVPQLFFLLLSKLCFWELKLTVCPGLTLKSESRYKYMIKLSSTQKLIFQDQEVFISSTASTKGGICVVVAIVVSFHQTEGTDNGAARSSDQGPSSSPGRRSHLV